MAGIYYSRWLALSTVVAVRAHARFLRQCVQHCLEVAAPSAAEAAEAALPGGRAALWRAGGRGWEREVHSPPAVYGFESRLQCSPTIPQRYRHLYI